MLLTCWHWLVTAPLVDHLEQLWAASVQSPSSKIVLSRSDGSCLSLSVTVCGCFINFFDYLIIDSGSMGTECQLMIVLKRSVHG